MIGLESSYECSSCKDVVSEARRSQHEAFWCSSIIDDDDDDDAGDSDNDDINKNKKGGLLQQQQYQQQPLRSSSSSSISLLHALQDHQLHKITNVTLSNGLQLSFEERSVFATVTSTGGALWKSELLLAEYVLEYLRRRRMSSMMREDTTNTNINNNNKKKINAASIKILELGCGAAPAAGLAAAASRDCHQVLMTDLSEVCVLAETNLRRNWATISSSRSCRTTGSSSHEDEDKVGGRMIIGREVCDTCALDWDTVATTMITAPTIISTSSTAGGHDDAPASTNLLSSSSSTPSLLPLRVQALLPFSLIICGDCIWSSSTHEMLAGTIARLLWESSSSSSSPSSTEIKKDHHHPQQHNNDDYCKCILAFQRRSDHIEEDFFQVVCPKYGIEMKRIPDFEQQNLINKLPSPPQGGRGTNANSNDNDNQQQQQEQQQDHAELEICELVLMPILLL